MPKERTGTIKNQDVVAATLVVGTDLASADYLTIQAAVDALPAAGGTIYLREVTFSPTATVTLANKSIRFVGSGWSTVIDLASTRSGLSGS